jgi:nucleoid DNA-binding protein
MAQGLTIYFSVHANPLKNENGETTYQVRQDTRGSLSTKGLEKYMRDNHIMPTINLDSVVEMISRLLAEKMVDNAKVHLEGLGVFSLTLGLKPKIDEEGQKHKRVVTNPETITGNDVEVTGVSFVPDKAFMETIRNKYPHFSQTGGKGKVGHSPNYSETQVKTFLSTYLSEKGFINRRMFQFMTGVTKYKTRQWLTQLSTGDNPFLIEESRMRNLYYYLNPDYSPE